jgi:predicted dehydrogenase
MLGMPDKTGFAIIGCGMISQIHAACIKELEGAGLVGAYDRNDAAKNEFCLKHSCEAYASLESLLRDKRVSAAAVLTPSGLHGEIGGLVAQSGKHVIVEKPLETTLEKANALIAASRAAGVKLCCISQYRFDKNIAQLKNAIVSGELGTLCFGACHTKWFRSQGYYDSAGWRGTWEMDGGGALMNQSIHHIDLLRYLMGSIEEVSAYCATRAHTGIEVEDVGVAAVRFKNGAVGLIEGNTAAWPGYYARLDIYGTNGSAIIQNDSVCEWHMKSGLELAPDTGEERVTATASAAISHDLHMLQYRDILDAILLDREPLVNGEEALETLKVILAVYESARLNKPVFVGLDKKQC